VNLDDMGLVDPAHSSGNAWLDWVTGVSVRQALPARIERVARSGNAGWWAVLGSNQRPLPCEDFAFVFGSIKSTGYKQY
jgi:hypothetical protein